MENNSLLDYLIRGFEIISASYGTVLLNDWLKRRNQKGKDLKEDFERKSKILPILDQIRMELDAERVFEMSFSNGDTTLSGHHLKKVSILLESNKAGIVDIANDFQFVPTKIFERMLSDLYESPEDYIVSNEYKKYDELAALYSQYNMQSMVFIKLKNQVNRWVGVLVIAFENQRVVTDGELAFCKMQAAKIGAIK